MNKKPFFLLAFIFFAILLAFPTVLKKFNLPELFLGFPLLIVYLVVVSLMILITWIIFYFTFYRK